jgi:hypothetical protein
VICQWTCETLDSDVVFAKADVSCEGYDYPTDPFILAGSCGLEYHLKPVPAFAFAGVAVAVLVGAFFVLALCSEMCDPRTRWSSLPYSYGQFSAWPSWPTWSRPAPVVSPGPRVPHIVHVCGL